VAEASCLSGWVFTARLPPSPVFPFSHSYPSHLSLTLNRLPCLPPSPVFRFALKSQPDHRRSRRFLRSNPLIRGICAICGSTTESYHHGLRGYHRSRPPSVRSVKSVVNSGPRGGAPRLRRRQPCASLSRGRLPFPHNPAQRIANFAERFRGSGVTFRATDPPDSPAGPARAP
jgi:hypothetical protein